MHRWYVLKVTYISEIYNTLADYGRIYEHFDGSQNGLLLHILIF